MNILFCVPNESYKSEDFFMPQIGAAYISAYIKKTTNYSVYAINFILEKRTIYEALLETIVNKNIDVICCGDLIINYHLVKEILDSAKLIKPNIKSIIGGGMVTYSAIEVMTLIPNADFGVLGEGELTVCELLNAIELENTVEDISGIIYRKNNELVLTQRRKDIIDIDSIPFPDYEGFQFGKFFLNHSASVTASRSCPFSCTFCSHSGGRTYRQRSLNNIFEECKWLISSYGIRRIYFSDDLFAVNTERLYQFCAMIKDLNIEWAVLLRVGDSITPEVLAEMKSSGCIEIFYGLESADPEVLKSMNKKITVQQIERVLKITRDARIDAKGNFIFGDLAETMESANRTLNWVREHRYLLARVRFYPIIAYPGSPLYDKSVEMGLIKNPIEHIRKGCPQMNLSKMSDEEYHRLIQFTLPKEQSLLMAADVDMKFNDLNNIEASPITWTCPKCGHNVSDNVDLRTMYIVRDIEFVCHECNAVSKTSLAFPYLNAIKEALFEVMQSKQCAIWGTGHFFRYMFPAIIDATATDIDITLCDMSKRNQILGFDVRSTDVLKDTKFEFCIIMTMYYSTVLKDANLLYPHMVTIPFHELGKALMFTQK